MELCPVVNVRTADTQQPFCDFFGQGPSDRCLVFSKVRATSRIYINIYSKTKISRDPRAALKPPIVISYLPIHPIPFFIRKLR